MMLLRLSIGRIAVVTVISLQVVLFCVAEPPNILFILVDDMAWSDPGCYGHPWHETPNIDSLATDGLLFTDAYAPAPICSASRASILTGKTPARIGLEFVVKDRAGEQVIVPSQPLKAPPFTLSLDLREKTTAEHLLEAGFETAYFGKWHLNPYPKGAYLAWSPTEGPAQQGFLTAEEDFGSHPYSKRDYAEVEPSGEYYPDEMTDRAIRFIKKDHASPFFLMVSHFYVHTPVKSPYKWLRDKYDEKIPDDIPNRVKRVEYAAFMETLDHYIGQLLDAIEAAGLAESTLVVFFSDNGGHPEYVSNKPLRGSKWNLYEGGIRIPMLIRWPGIIRGGTVCNSPVTGYDLHPTFAEIAGKPLDVSGASMDGESLLPLLTGSRSDQVRSLYWHFPYYHPEGTKFGNALKEIGMDDFAVSQTRPQSAIRHGDYKLIYFEEDKRCELYNLAEDMSEQHDLSRKDPDTTRMLEQKLLRYLDSVNARRAVLNTRQAE